MHRPGLVPTSTQVTPMGKRDHGAGDDGGNSGLEDGQGSDDGHTLAHGGGGGIDGGGGSGDGSGDGGADVADAYTTTTMVSSQPPLAANTMTVPNTETPSDSTKTESAAFISLIPRFPPTTPSPSGTSDSAKSQDEHVLTTFPSSPSPTASVAVAAEHSTVLSGSSTTSTRVSSISAESYTASGTSSPAAHSIATSVTVVGIIVAVLVVLSTAALLFRFRRTTFIQRALGRFRRHHGTGAQYRPYYQLEKPKASRKSPTHDTVVGVSTKRIIKRPAPQSTCTSDDGSDILDIKTSDIRPSPTADIYPSSLTSKTGQAFSDVSQPTRPTPSKRDLSGRRSYANHRPATASVSSLPELGTAVSIAGSEVRLVRISRRASRPATSSLSSGGGHWQRSSSRTMSEDPRPPPPLRSSLASSSVRQAWTADSGPCKPYHPALGNRGSYGSVSCDSLASSSILSPDSMSWPAPPRTSARKT